MKNLVLLLLLANILYFVWGKLSVTPHEPGVEIVTESALGPGMAVTANRGVDAVASVGEILGSGSPSELAAVVGRSCVTIGPFKTASDAEVARTAYAGEGMRTNLRSARGQVFVGHWVKIPNLADRAEGREIVRQLDAAGINEAYPVREDDDSFSVSLIISGTLEVAEDIELEARSLGFEAIIEPFMQEDDFFVVDVALPPGEGAGAIIDRFGEDKVLLRDAATCP
jgi:hypothetical protein